LFKTFIALIDETIKIVQQTDRFHLLIIISDGEIDQTLKSAHIAKLREVAKYPLSIVCIGVGDGSFEDMEKFDDQVEGRIDIFNFVNYNKVTKSNNPDEQLMLQTLMEVPDHYMSAQTRLGYKPKYGPLVGKMVHSPPPYA